MSLGYGHTGQVLGVAHGLEVTDLKHERKLVPRQLLPVGQQANHGVHAAVHVANGREKGGWSLVLHFQPTTTIQAIAFLP
jgi:hypothetical protein